MKFASSAVALAPVVFVLAACGGGAEEAEQPVDAAPQVSETSVPADGATPAPAETPAPEPTPSETPTPAATPASNASPAASVAVTEPASFAQCKACHSVEPGKNGIGPTLAGVWGARAGHIDGFNYSDALIESGLVWDQNNLDRYLADPRGVIPGTKMAFGGVKDAAKRQEIINYLKTL